MKIVITDSGVQFQREQKDGKIVVAATEAFIAPMDADKALDSLKHEVSQRGNVTRAALSSLLLILQSPRMDGYAGIGDINAEGGIPKEVKTAVRSAEEGYFSPMFKDTKKLDLFLTSIRDAGIYATAKGVALKYFFFKGELPCLYVNGHPQTDKLLSVSAMQKILSNMVEEKEEKDKSIARQVLELQEVFEKTDNLTRDNLLAILNNLTQFANEVRQAVNQLDADVTDKTANILPAQSIAVDDAIAAEYARIEREAEEALM